MTEIDGYEGSDDDAKVKWRLQRNTYIYILVAMLAAFFWSGRKMMLGVALGSMLSLFNKRWLEGSMRAMLNHYIARETGKVPPYTVSKFILRYFVIALVIGAAVFTRRVHPLGIGIGFAALVGGVVIETAYQLYLGFKTNPNSSQE
ncbi:MAG TPA: ATP synthase subunit I [Blastocatellia bacterium]|nr:ATP synthase subunit I [Blastocatellia bacterium]